MAQRETGRDFSGVIIFFIIFYDDDSDFDYSIMCHSILAHVSIIDDSSVGGFPGSSARMGYHLIIPGWSSTMASMTF